MNGVCKSRMYLVTKSQKIIAKFSTESNLFKNRSLHMKKENLDNKTHIEMKKTSFIFVYLADLKDLWIKIL